MSFKIDTKAFKKVGGNAKVTVLQHADGHSLTISHKHLSPKWRAQLTALPSAEVATPEEMEEGRTSQKMKLPKLADGGKPEDELPPGALPTEDSPIEIVPEAQLPAAAATAETKNLPQMAEPETPLAYRIGKGIRETAALLPKIQPWNPTLELIKQTKQLGAGISGAPSVNAVPQTATATQGEASAAQPAPPPVEGIAKPETKPTGEDVSPFGIMGKGAEQEMVAIKGQAGVEERWQKQQADLEGQAAAINQAEAEKEQVAQQQAQLADEHFTHDIQNGFIKPEHYMESMPAVQKAMTAIGILLGGFSAGVGKGNPALEFLNKQIDRDISAQEKNLGAKQNLLWHNLQLTKDMRDARALTRAQMMSGLAHQINQQAALAASDKAKFTAQQLTGQVMQQKGMLLSQVRGGPSILQPGADPMEQQLQAMRLLNPAMAKEIESRYIPGVGMASIPLSEQNRSQVVARKSLDESLQALMDFSRKYGGTAAGALSPSVRAQGESLSKQVQDTYRRANDQGVFKPAEATFVRGVIGDTPSSLFAKFTKQPAYMQAIAGNRLQLQQLYSSLGLRPTRAPGQQPASSFSFKPLK